jgi:hypothetical protein
MFPFVIVVNNSNNRTGPTCIIHNTAISLDHRVFEVE